VTKDDVSVRAMSFEEMLDEHGYVVYTNVGYSMMPLLRQRRDIIEIRAKGPGRCKKYDVVLYKQRGLYILHRVLEVRHNYYVVAGDNNAFLDPPVTDDQILGVMTRVIRDGKSITVDDRVYRAYVRLWCAPYRARMGLLRTRGKLGTVKRKIIKRARK